MIKILRFDNTYSSSKFKFWNKKLRKINIWGVAFYTLLFLALLPSVQSGMESKIENPNNPVPDQKETEIAELIAELCLSAPSEPIKFCLRLYQYGKSLPHLEKDFRKQKRDVLRDTAEYLNIPGFMDKTKDTLAHLVICRIQNLLPDDCNICKARYKINRSDKPLLECSICGQGVHTACFVEIARAMQINRTVSTVDEFKWDAENFKSVFNPLKLPGLFYICEACQPNIIPSEDEGNYKRLKKSSEDTSQQPEATQQDGPPAIESSQIEPVQTTESSEIEDSQAQESFIPATNDVDDDDNQSTSAERHTNDDAPESEKSKTICRFFRNGNCKYGMTGKECKFTHPKVCSKFRQHGTRQPRGCNRGKKCKDFHPKMCLNSLRKGECFSETCRFHHVKGTKRHPPVVNNISSTTQSNEPNARQASCPAQSTNSSRNLHNVRPGSSGTSGDNPLSPPAPGSNESQEIPAQSSDGTDHFLQMIRLLKQEILQTLDQKMLAINAQVKQIQQAQSLHQSQPIPQMLRPQLPPGFPPTIQNYQQQQHQLHIQPHQQQHHHQQQQQQQHLQYQH